ncbi:nitronate monooxygenase family protein [Bradyrhizobium lablabi]|uniref:NAD(P)H-dependent flavin oxidoreductase n=1 Tax=Bradyrhizobium lablabi TaxID=722472 RepID=UPI001BA44A9C|nr:nitronate monooxygenase [Bradyrhizobium lablabi]MBR0697042.1 nitronate monooxygenase [Bradyrhizobium lablabi]
MLKTRITEQYGLKIPFINAGMAFIATAALARAVCEAGGMGMLGAAAMPPDVLQAAIRDVKAVKPKCFGVDIIARFSAIEHIEVCIAEKVPVVVFFWDDVPDEWLSRLRAAGSHVWFQVGSVAEAEAAVRSGAQGIVVQGNEAGGHNRAVAATFSLLPAVIDAVPSVPVVAAGGIADGRTVAAALALGAEAVWVGTRLLASFEAYAHPQYKERVLAAGVEDTARHLIFGPEFPDASTRGLRNRIVREWERRDNPPPYRVVSESELPVIGQACIYGQEIPMKRFCGFPPTPEFTGDFDEMSLLAGESVGQTRRLMSAAAIIDEMISGAESVIRKRFGSMVVD